MEILVGLALSLTVAMEAVVEVVVVAHQGDQLSAGQVVFMVEVVVAILTMVGHQLAVRVLKV
jgi:hypothetical protein